MHRVIKHPRAGCLRRPRWENERIMERINPPRSRYSSRRPPTRVSFDTYFKIGFTLRFPNPFTFTLRIRLSLRFGSSATQARGIEWTAA